MDKNGVQDSKAPNSESPGRSACRKRVALSESGDNSNGGDRGNEEKSGGNNGDHERERRKKMKNMFTILHHLLPHLPAKVDQFTFVDEAVKCIKTLENTLNNLEKQKEEKLQSIKTKINLDMIEKATREAMLAPKLPSVYKTWTSPNVALNVCGHDAHINICCSMKPGLLATLCFVLEKYEIDAISIHVSSFHNRSMYMIHTRVTREYACQFPIEEIYKQAAREIVMLCE